MTPYGGEMVFGGYKGLSNTRNEIQQHQNKQAELKFFPNITLKKIDI